MRFRTGLVVGLGAGYVLGAKAGRERYEQIMRLIGRVADSEPVVSTVEQVVHPANGNRVRNAVSSGLRAAGDSLRARSEPQRRTG